MVEQREVDVDRSLEFNKANGRLKKSEKKETANYKRKTYVCPKCRTHYVTKLKEFGEVEVCPKCKIPMTEKL